MYARKRRSMPGAGSPKRPVGGSASAPGPLVGQTAPPAGASSTGRPRLNKTWELFVDGTRPPYSREDRIRDGVRCFMCGEDGRVFTDWLTLRRHLQFKHGMRAGHIKGTYFDKITTEMRQVKRSDKVLQEIERELTVKDDPGARSLPSGHNVSSQTSCNPSNAPSPRHVAHQPAQSGWPDHQQADRWQPQVPITVKEELPHENRSPTWTVMPVMVRCHASGVPTSPPIYGGIAHGWSVVRPGPPILKSEVPENEIIPHNVKEAHYVGSSSALAVGSPAPCELAKAEAVAGAIRLPAPAGREMPSRPDCATAAAPQPGDYNTGRGRSAAMVPTTGPLAGAKTRPAVGDGEALTGPFQMLTELVENTRAMNDSMSEMRDTTRWRKGLPSVEVKEKYITLAALEERTPGGRKRCSYPACLAQDKVELPEFKNWLTSYCRTDEERSNTLVLGAGRLLGMLNFIQEDVSSKPIGPDDCLALVALSVSEKHFELLDLTVLKPHFNWTMNCIDGMRSYCEFHSYHMSKQVNLGVPGFWKEYLASLAALSKDFKTGNLKRCREEKDKSLSNKHKEDLKVLKDWPKLHDLQAAVLEGYMTLLLIADTYEGACELPRAARGAVNVAMAGAIHYDTFASRKDQQLLPRLLF